MFATVSFPTPRVTGVATALALALLAVPSQARAEFIVGLTTANQITTFDSATPGQATAPVAITGLVGGDALVGIDRRPSFTAANGLIYGIGVSGGVGRLYTINATTGVATAGAVLTNSIGGGVLSITGASFGVDFNPTVDRLRFVTDTDQNFRINPDTGVTVVDGTLAYAGTDTNAGANPQVVGAAYTNNFAGATSTVLRDLDANLDILAIQNPPNSGTLNTSVALGVNFGPVAAYDISGLTGTPYAALVPAGAAGSSFYTLGAGGATLVGAVTTSDGTALTLNGLAAPVGLAVVTPAPATVLVAGFGGLGLIGTRLRRKARGVA